jgi:predicted RND superfamily exporter protein
MRKTFFARYSFLILLIVCFCTPLVLRGARDTLRQMKNDVTDWLPKQFKETADIEWFWDHFAGERFIIVTWAGCTGEATDEAFQLFKKKLAPSIPPSKQGIQFVEPPAKDVGSTWLERPFEFIGDRLGLYSVTEEYQNWGGLDEKWLRGQGGKWYYVLPNGDLFEFTGAEGPLPALGRGIWHRLGLYELTGKQLAQFGPIDGPWYYKNTNRLSAQFFRSVVTGPDVLQELTKQDESGVSMMSEKEAMSKLRGVLFGPDEKQTAIVITVTDAGRADFHRVLGRGVLGKERGLLYKIAEDCGIHADDLRLGGPPVDNVAIDEEGNITLVRLVSLVVIFCLGLSYLSFRSWMATAILFLTGGISAALGLAIVGWTGESADAVMMSMPALVYVLGISGAVHIINYYREAVDEHGLEGAPERALAHAWKPAVLCNLTTSFGLLSLYAAEVVPIQKFGLYAAAGVMATSIMLFTFVPAALQMFPLHLSKRKQRQDGAESWLDAYLANYWERFGGGIIRHYVSVGVACFLIIGVVGYGALRINTSVNLLELFDGDAKILRDYNWIETNLGKLIPMEVVVKFAPDSVRPANVEGAAPATPKYERAQLSAIDRVEAVSKVQAYVARYLGEGPGAAGVVGQSMSAVTFTPKLPKPDDYTTRFAFDSRLNAERDQLLKSDFFKIDLHDSSELWRISLRVAAFMGVDYGDFVKDLRKVVEPVLAAYNVRYQIIHDAVERQAKQQASGQETSNIIRVGFVLPDTLYKSAFPPAVAKKRPAQKATENAAASAVEPGATTEKFVGAEIDDDLIFTQTLNGTLLSARVRIDRLRESTLKKEQLDGLDCVVLLGDLQPATVQVVNANSQQIIDSKKILTEAVAPLPTEDAKATKVAAAPQTKHATVSAVYTGVVPIVYKAQRTLLTSLISSTVWSFLTITPLMILVSRSIGAGLVAMLPNALPVLVIFGAMGWMGIQVDIGSMMTASIALGVAVDDTIHYLTWFREELARLGDRKLAIIGAYRRCATPTLQAASISGLGLSIFAFSTFTPTQRFGYLMLAILFAGVVAELVFFPALLASPLGWVFKVPRKSNEPPAETGASESEPNEPDTEGPATVRIEAARDASKRIA